MVAPRPTPSRNRLRRQLPVCVLISMLSVIAADQSRVIAAQAASISSSQPATQSQAVLERLIADNLRLLTGNNEPSARVVGARELLRMESPAAWDRLAAVLRNYSDPAAQAAVCQSVIESPIRRAVLVEPLFELLGAEQPAMRRGAAVALSRCIAPAAIDRLRALSSQRSAPLARRLGAIEALGAMGDEKAAVAALMNLLTDPNAEIVAAALDKIDDSSDVDLVDVAAARAWWDENRNLDPVAWLKRRNEQLRARIDRAAFGTGLLTARLLTAQRNAYYTTPDADKDKLVLEFLNDPLAEIRGIGVELIDARITDRKTVAPEITTRVEALVADVNPQIRRGAVAVLGDLRDKSRVPALLTALKGEPASQVRAAIVSALGRIGGSAATSAVQAALDDSSPQVQAEAALALASLAEPGVAPAEVVRAAADTLDAHYRKLLDAGRPITAASPSDAVLDTAARDFDLKREACLNAMSRVADPRFRPQFLDAVESSNVRLGPSSAAVRRAGIRGLVATDDGTASARLRRLLDDADPSVRTAAAEAIGKCLTTDDDLTALLVRLDSSREPEESTRLKAWESLRSLLKRRPVEQQLVWADRLAGPADRPALERSVELLAQAERRLVDPSVRQPNGSTSAPVNGRSPDETPAVVRRAEVLERLANANLALDRPAVAASYFEQAAQAVAADGRSTSAPAERQDELDRARRLMTRAVEALLIARRYDALPQFVERNRSGPGDAGLLNHDEIADRIEAAVSERLDASSAASAPELARALDQILDADPLFTPQVHRRLEVLKKRLRGNPTTSSGPADEDFEP